MRKRGGEHEDQENQRLNLPKNSVVDSELKKNISCLTICPTFFAPKRDLSHGVRTGGPLFATVSVSSASSTKASPSMANSPFNESIVLEGFCNRKDTLLT